MISFALLLLFTALSVYYALKIPTNEHAGYWSLYKLVQWGYLPVLSFQVLALSKIKIPRLKVEYVFALLCLLGFPYLLTAIFSLTDGMRAFSRSEQPLKAYYELGEYIKTSGKTKVYLVGPDFYPKTYLPYFIQEMPTYGIYSKKSIDEKIIPGKSVLVVCAGCPFNNPRNTELSANTFLVTEPVVSNIQSPDEKPEPRDDGLFFWVGNRKEICLDIFSVKPGKIRALFKVYPGPGIPENARRSFKVTLNGEAKQVFNTDGTSAEAAFDFAANLGANRACFTSLDKTSSQDVARELRQRLIQIQIYDLQLLSEEKPQ